jgi:ribonuclease Z
VPVQAPALAQQAPAACYVCQLADVPGKFLPEKAAALGVPKGPLFGRLKAGNAVQAADGRTVQPSEVRIGLLCRNSPLQTAVGRAAPS